MVVRARRGGFVRRRPLLRTAVIGGGAYMAGRAGARRSADQAQQESSQDERINDLEQAQQAPPPAQQAPPAGDSMLDQLDKLTALHGQGALTDAEFSAAKAKLLAAGT